MCLGIPGLVIQAPDVGDVTGQGVVEFGGVRRTVCLACVPEARPGDYVIIHAGIAISRIDPDEAGRVLRYLRDDADDDGWAGEGGSA